MLVKRQLCFSTASAYTCTHVTACVCMCVCVHVHPVHFARKFFILRQQSSSHMFPACNAGMDSKHCDTSHANRCPVSEVMVLFCTRSGCCCMYVTGGSTPALNFCVCFVKHENEQKWCRHPRSFFQNIGFYSCVEWRRFGGQTPIPSSLLHYYAVGRSTLRILASTQQITLFHSHNEIFPGSMHGSCSYREVCIFGNASHGSRFALVTNTVSLVQWARSTRECSENHGCAHDLTPPPRCYKSGVEPPSRSFRTRPPSIEMATASS